MGVLVKVELNWCRTCEEDCGRENELVAEMPLSLFAQPPSTGNSSLEPTNTKTPLMYGDGIIVPFYQASSSLVINTIGSGKVLQYGLTTMPLSTL